MAKHSHQTLQKSCLIICLILILLLMINSPVSAAGQTRYFSQTSKTDCLPVDIVFLIDNSPDVSIFDPNNYRDKSIEWMMNFLGYDRLLNCPSVVHRISYIGINDPTNNFLELTPLRPDIKDQKFSENLNNTINGLMNSISVQSTNSRSAANLKQSLQMAVDLVNNAPKLENHEERKKVIFLLIAADGSPCVLYSCTYDEVNSDQAEFSSTLDQLDDTTVFSTVILGNGAFNIYKNSEGNTYTQFWGDVVKKHNGAISSAKSIGAKLPKFWMDQILTMSHRTDVLNVCGTAQVDPFLSNIGFNVFSEVPLNNPKFNTSNGESSQTLDYIATEPSNVSYYLFHHPVGGKWEFEINCNNNKAVAYMQIQRASKLKIEAPSETETLPQFESSNSVFDTENPYFVKFKVVDSAGEGIKNLSDILPNALGTITSPNGESIPINFNYSDGIFASNEALPTSQRGTYEIQIKLTILVSSEESSKSFEIIQNSTYEVNPRTLFTFELVSPRLDDKFAVHGTPWSYWMEVKPVQIEVRLKPVHEQDETKLSGQSIVNDPNQAFKVILQSPTMEKEEISLVPSQTKPLTFVGFVGKSFSLPGNYSLGVKFSESYNKSLFLFQDNRTDSSITFERQDGILELPLTYWFLLTMISAILCVILLYTLYLNTNKVAGYLLFTPPGDNMRPFYVLDLSQKKRRNIHFNHDELRKEHFLLSNIQAISISTPNLFGRSQTIQIIDKDDKAETVQKPSSRSSDDKVFIKTTDGFYTVSYSTVPHLLGTEIKVVKD